MTVQVLCRECRAPVPNGSRTRGFCGAWCAYVHHVRRTEGPQAAIEAGRIRDASRAAKRARRDMAHHLEPTEREED